MEKRFTSSSKRIVEFYDLIDSNALKVELEEYREDLESNDTGRTKISQDKLLDFLNKYLEPYNFEISKDYSSHQNNINSQHKHDIIDKDVLDDVETHIGHISINKLLGYSASIYMDDLDGVRVGKNFIVINDREVLTILNPNWHDWSTYCKEKNLTWNLNDIQKEYAIRTLIHQCIDEGLLDVINGHIMVTRETTDDSTVWYPITYEETIEDLKNNNQFNNLKRTFFEVLLEKYGVSKKYDDFENLMYIDHSLYEINFFSHNENVDFIREHSYRATNVTNEKDSYIFEIVQERRNGKLHFHVSKDEYKTNIIGGEWWHLSDLFKNTKTQEIIKNTLIDISEHDIQKNNYNLPKLNAPDKLIEFAKENALNRDKLNHKEIDDYEIEPFFHDEGDEFIKYHTYQVQNTHDKSKLYLVQISQERGKEPQFSARKYSGYIWSDWNTLNLIIDDKQAITSIKQKLIELSDKAISKTVHQIRLNPNDYGKIVQDIVKIAKSSENHTWFIEVDEFKDGTYSREDLNELFCDLHKMEQAGVEDIDTIVDAFVGWKVAEARDEPVVTFHGAFLDLFDDTTKQNNSLNTIEEDLDYDDYEMEM